MSMYSPELTLRDARTLYFKLNNFGDDGGYNDRWVKTKLGPFPYWIPNTKGRKEAVKYHDLHHILTGYATTWRGEFEIGAWEVSTGLGRQTAGKILDLVSFAAGLAVNPSEVYRAFLRGRQSSNLFTRVWGEELLERRVGEVRRELSLDKATKPATLADKVSFVLWAAVAVATYLAVAAVMLSPLVVPALAILWLKGA
ncbi:MAG TPA: hypothetical protein VM934_08820 [Pyrinomonadaceae bacterium]|jgi:hypothetical protein|nr:hypothetical protein [Pyrinomonadaceae bacterium]